ncbi:hypothetical protein IMCC12053_1057 [Celeribacter marinus]|uniref:Uncharacterized protein n=1 Tax=Celeribacter marinus TaxID=1397108 RepID=A0A0N7HIE6_9RHOB|nr:hypothetical protein IMCC12053_1057 [Celeribacter marinus]
MDFRAGFSLVLRLAADWPHEARHLQHCAASLGSFLWVGAGVM